MHEAKLQVRFARCCESLRRIAVGMSLLAAACPITGCQAPGPVAGPTQMVMRIPDHDAFIDASLSILRRYDLPPERVDRARGLIVTQRTTSGQWFEPWRVDSQGPYQVLESSLHTVGRVVTIQIDPASSAEPADPDVATAQTQSSGSDAGEIPRAAAVAAKHYRVSVRADKSRYSAPERQITTASGALAIYSEKIPTTEGLRRAQAQRPHWVPLGRDPLLEAFLLAKLADATPEVEPVGRPPSSTQRSTAQP